MTAALLALLLLGTDERLLQAELTLPASVDAVWTAWTTDEGVRTFFAPGSHVEARIDGAYDILFDPDGEPGGRGAEGMRVIALEPQRRLVFTWNQPPHLVLRPQRTIVILDFEPLGAERTRLRFRQVGWGDGADWDAAYAYFDKAWGSVVLPRLAWRFAHGPIDWAHPPTVEPLPGSLRVSLRPAS